MVVDVVGLDLSLTSTGIALGDDWTDAFVSKKKGMERLDEILDRIQGTVCWLPTPYVVVEGYAFARRANYAFSLGELGGLVKYWCWKNDIPVVEVPPTLRAKFATGRGNANKSEVVSAISARTGMTFAGSGADDMVDAWILLEMGKQHFNQSDRSWPQQHMEALKKVEWVDEWPDFTGRD